MSKKKKKAAEGTGPADQVVPDSADHLDEAASGPEGPGPNCEERAAEPFDSEELQELRDKLAVERDLLLRTAAELDNLRKRGRREVADARRFARADVLRPLLDVLDNFDRALHHAGDGTGDAEPVVPGDGNPGDASRDSFRKGVVMIAQNFRQVLRDCGVRPIEAVGRPFDPAFHEAVGQAPADKDNPSGTVLAELQAGYTFDDLVLRASRVIVAQ